MCMHDEVDDKKTKIIKLMSEYYKQAVAQQQGALKNLSDQIDTLMSHKSHGGKTHDPDEELKERQ